MSGEMCDAIRIMRERRGYTQDELAERTGISRISIARYEAGRVDPTAKALRRIADALDISADALLQGNVLDKPHVSPGAIRVPIYGTIPAGIPTEAIEDIIDYEEVPADWARGGREYFGLKIRGDSMSPKYNDGDVVIFRKVDTCESGQDCAVMVNSDEATFKRVKLESWGVALIPINPEYETRIYDNQQVEELPVRVLGVAVQIRRDV